MMLAIMGAFVWANATQDLAQFGTVEHVASDGSVKSNPICLYGMIFATAVGVIIAAAMLGRAERLVIVAGDNAERDGYADPIAPVTRAARSGCGTAFAWLAGLGVVGMVIWIFSVVAGGT